jgi:hypothetical protein
MRYVGVADFGDRKTFGVAIGSRACSPRVRKRQRDTLGP